MSYPEMITGQTDPGVSAQLLLKISNDVSGLVTDVAVIKEQTRAISDHEDRIRQLRAEVPPKLAERLTEVESHIQQERGGRDVWARVAGGVGIAAATAAAVATFVHH
jgi:hypothetical protein